MAREINQTEYETEVVGSPVPVLLDIYGEHCGPCRQLAPTIDRLAGEYEGRAKVLKVDAGENRELASSLGVSSVPTVDRADETRRGIAAAEAKGPFSAPLARRPIYSALSSSGSRRKLRTGGAGPQSSKRRRISVVFWPPKPKLFDMATSTFRSRAA
jgi:thioredoxin 1